MSIEKIAKIIDKTIHLIQFLTEPNILCFELFISNSELIYIFPFIFRFIFGNIKFVPIQSYIIVIPYKIRKFFLSFYTWATFEQAVTCPFSKRFRTYDSAFNYNFLII